MSCSKMSKAVSSFAVDSQMLPNGSPAADSLMPPVGSYAAGSPMLLPAVDKPPDAVSVTTDWYAQHLDTESRDVIVRRALGSHARLGGGFTAHGVVCDDTLHRMVALRYHEIEGRDQTLPPTGSSVAGSSAADRLMSLNESSAAGMRLLPNEGINRSPAETSSHSSVVGSDDETDPEMPGLVDARPSMRADWPPRLVSGTFYSSNFNRPIFADYVGHRLRTISETDGLPPHRHGQAIAIQRTSDDHPAVARYELVSQNHLAAALQLL